MRVHVVTEADPGGWERSPRGLAQGVAPACWGSWRPVLRLGADSVGGLMLPTATPSASTLYAPRGVWIDAERVVVCDTGNHRVLIWHGWPGVDGAAADVVLGQVDFSHEGAAGGGLLGAAAGLQLPTGVLVADGRLVVADAWHHRVLVWDSVPSSDGAAPDHVIGQADASSVEPNRGGCAAADTFYWPFGVALIDGRFYVADTGNRRVLGWSGGLPLDGRDADLVLGQPDPASRDENRSADAGPRSFRWPHAVAGTGDGGLFVADAGNHRLLRWDLCPSVDGDADHVVGQPDFTTVSELPYQPQRGHLRFPYAVASLTGGLAVADTANNRVLIWDRAPVTGSEPADAALGQYDFDALGENRWEAVTPDTLCWPYGLAACGDRLAIADSGNNRVVIWERHPVEGS